MALCFMIGEGFAADRTAAEVSLNRKKPLTVLFTSDLHSKLDNVPYLKFLIDAKRRVAEERGDAVVVVDAGDMAMGTVYSTLFSSSATELLSLGMLGYDAVCFGNHDFDYGTDSLAKMFFTADSISAITDNPIKLPAFLNSNLRFENNTLNRALQKIKSGPDTIIVSNGVRVGIIGSVGEDCFSTIADSKGIEYINQKEVVAESADDLRNRGADYVILLSHSGTYSKKGALKSSDASLAQSLQGRVDAIISGHDHIQLFKPLRVGNVVIGNAGCYGRYLGEMRLNGDSLEYSLYNVDFSPGRDSNLLKWLEIQKNRVNDHFVDMFGVSASDTVAVIDTPFEYGRDGFGNYPLGNLVAESYRSTALPFVSDDIVAVVPDGTVRNSLSVGAVTYADCYETLSLGMDSDGRVGYPLVLIYLYGSELYDVAELTPSIGDYMPDVKLSFAGFNYIYNSKRLPLFKVKEVFVGKQKVIKDKLYPVVGSYYTASLLRLMEESSLGLLKVVPKDARGNVVTDLKSCILKDSVGNDMVEWKVFADYLKMADFNSCKHNALSSSRIGKVVYAKIALDRDNYFVWLLYTTVLSLAVLFVLFVIKVARRMLRNRR